MNPAEQFGLAWITMGLAITLHVADEAMTEFLPVYNAAVVKFRKRIPFLPPPTFTFGLWLGGSCLGIVAELALSPMAFHGNRTMILVSYPLAVIMFGNGIGHIAGSLYGRRWMPGVYSSPVLLLASVFLFLSARAMG